MSRIHTHADQERDPLLHPPERSPYGYPELNHYAFITNNSQDKDATPSSTSLMSLYNTPPFLFPFSPTPNAFENSPQMLRTSSRQNYLGLRQARPDHDFSISAPITGFGQHSPRELQYAEQTLQDTSPRDPFDLEAFPYGRHENRYAPGFGNFVTDWSASPVTLRMYSRPTNDPSATSTCTRMCTTSRHQDYQYLDSLLRSNCPKDGPRAPNVSIQSRDERGIDEPISNDPLEPAGDEKTLCFCCSRARTITPARDRRGHVRHPLGNFPSWCSNSRCRAFDSSPKDQFDLEVHDNATHSSPHDTGYAAVVGNCVRGWSTSSVTPSMYSRPSSSLKATSTHTRISRTRQHHQCLDDWLRLRCPKNRIDALNMAIQFRDAYGADQPIPDELVDEHLEENADGKFIFWGDKTRKARNKTGARDHVRKLLGNFPFCCSNLGCEHSSLRRADLNKHMKSCKFPPPPSFSPTVSWEVQNLEFPAPDLSTSASLTPQEQNTVVDTDALLDITHAGEDIMDSYLTFPPLGGEYEAGIGGAE